MQLIAKIPFVLLLLFCILLLMFLDELNMTFILIGQWNVYFARAIPFPGKLIKSNQNFKNNLYNIFMKNILYYMLNVIVMFDLFQDFQRKYKIGNRRFDIIK